MNFVFGFGGKSSWVNGFVRSIPNVLNISEFVLSYFWVGLRFG